MKFFLLIVIAFAVITSDVCAYKILGLFPFMAKSHFIVGNSLMKGLVKAGHEVSLQSWLPGILMTQLIDFCLQVTVMTAFPPKEKIDNYTVVDTSEILDAMKGNRFF